MQFNHATLTETGHVLVAGHRLQGGEFQPFIRVYILNSPSRGLSLLADFSLPRLSLTATPLPLLFWNPRHSSIDYSQIFDFCSSRNVLLHLWITYSQSIFIPLFALLRSDVTSLTPGSEALQFPWHTWGPQSTRFIEEPGRGVCLAGYRVIFPSEIWDFTPRRPTSVPDDDASLVSSPEVLPRSRLRPEEVITTLPYRRVEWEDPRESRGSYLCVIETENRPSVSMVVLVNPC